MKYSKTLYKIAGLLVDVPEDAQLQNRCAAYRCDSSDDPQLTIRTDLYRRDQYDPRLGDDTVTYMESAYQFCKALVNFGGFYLHASAVVRDGRAYLFSGPCRAGKSTHTRLWQQTFGDAIVINDDKPALRRADGTWFAYGTPWCGKDGINQNASAPIAGVCFLKKAKENKITRLDVNQAMKKILSQTIYKFETVEQLDLLLGHLDHFLREIPVYELENLPEPDAARLSFETMRQGAQEAGL